MQITQASLTVSANLGKAGFSPRVIVPVDETKTEGEAGQSKSPA